MFSNCSLFVSHSPGSAKQNVSQAIKINVEEIVIIEIKIGRVR